VKWFEVRDPIYGFVTFNEWERDIINHRAFQRLRRIRQLGLTEMVYPGATHTRFEHSLGVMHLATRMFDKIIEVGGELLSQRLGYEEKDKKFYRQLVRLAALLHDVGHGPFSHGTEKLMPQKQDKVHFKHEDYTCVVIEKVMKDVIDNHPVNKKHFKSRITARAVSALIKGDTSFLSPAQLFWKDLISGQLDADRGDYLIRDSHHTGVKYGVFDIDRLLATLRVGIYVEQEEEKVVIGIGEDGWRVAESLILARYHIFPQVYLHKTRHAYDLMLTEALKEVIGQFPPPDRIKEYLAWDDVKVWQAFRDRTDCRWCHAITRREHIRCIMERNLREKREVYKAKRELDKANIENYVDTAKKEWYQFGKEEILVISSTGDARPLSQYSRVIEVLGTQGVIGTSGVARLFAWPADRKRAEQLLGL